MADIDLVSPSRSQSEDDAGRRLERWRGLPSSRAVVGGFLVALAAVGIFAAWSGTMAGPTQSYLVAARPVAIGARLARADLALQPLELPQGFPAFTDPDDVLGKKVLGPLAAGELIQAGNVARRVEGSEGAQVAPFTVDADRVPDDLRTGERVDVLATYEGTAVTAVRNILVVDVDRPKVSSLGSPSRVSLKLAFTDECELLNAKDAFDSDKPTVVVSKGTAHDDAPGASQPSEARSLRRQCFGGG